MSDLAVYVPQPQVMSLDDKFRLCECLCKSSLLPAEYRNKSENVMLQILLGEALGIPPIIALQQTHIINGKPSSSAQIMAGLVLQAGHKLTVEGDENGATATLTRKGDNFTFKSFWGPEQTKKAGLGGNHNKYPQDMYRARAISAVCKMGAPDAICGLSLPEELEQPTEATSSDIPTQAQPAGRQYKHVQVGAPVPVNKQTEVVQGEVVDDVPAAPATPPAAKPKAAPKSKPAAEAPPAPAAPPPAAAPAAPPPATPPANIPDSENPRMILQKRRTRVYKLLQIAYPTEEAAREFMGGVELKNASLDLCDDWIEALEQMIQADA